MKVSTLYAILNSIQTEFANANIYIQMLNDGEEGFDATLLQDVSEVVFDVEDSVIIIRSI